MKSISVGRSLRTAIWLFAASSWSLSAQLPPSPITPTNEIALFDGKSLSGWTFVSQNTNAPAASIWSVTNGVIVCQGKPNGYARTWQTYRNYQLHAEWRYPDGAGNSGIFLHLNPPDQVWPFCFETQLLSGSAGEVRMNGGSAANGLTAQYPHSIPRQQPNSEKPLGEWNSCDNHRGPRQRRSPKRNHRHVCGCGHDRIASGRKTGGVPQSSIAALAELNRQAPCLDVSQRGEATARLSFKQECKWQRMACRVPTTALPSRSFPMVFTSAIQF